MILRTQFSSCLKAFSLTFLLFSGLSVAGTLNAQTLTLEESITIALGNNPAMHIARANLNKADATVDEAFSSGLPKINLNANYQRVDKVAVLDFGGESVETGNLNNRTADISLAQPIDIFGVIKTGKKAAKSGKSIYQYGIEQQINNTTLDTKTAFYNVLRAQKFLTVQEETLTLLGAHLKDAQANYDAGAIAKFDVLRAETQLANANQQLITARNGVELAKAAFNSVLGRPLSTPVELTEPQAKSFISVGLSECLDVACKVRPEVLQANSLVEVNKHLTKIASLSGKPRINLNWNYNRNFDTSLFNSRDNSWNAFLTASMPLYDGGATKASVDKAAADTDMAGSARDQIVLGVTLDAQQSYLSLKESEERIRAAEKGLEQATESMRLADVRYKGGVSTQLELLDAQTAMTLAKTNHVNAVYDYQVALAKLERAVGGQTQMAKLLENSGTKTAESLKQ